MINGLRFYTPEPIGDKTLTAYEWYEHLTTSGVVPFAAAMTDGAYALTPSGEQVLADLDVSELQKCEADVKRVNGQGRQATATVL